MRVVRNLRKLGGTVRPAWGGVSDMPEKSTVLMLAMAAETVKLWLALELS